MLILCYFWIVFLDAPLARPLIFWQEKGIEVVHILAKFYLCLDCSLEVFKFQMFSYGQKV